MWIEMFIIVDYLNPNILLTTVFVDFLYIWAKGIGIWNIFLRAQTLGTFQVLKLLMLNQKGSSKKTTFIFKCFWWCLVIIGNCLIIFFNVFCDTHTQFVILKIILCMAINLSEIKPIKLKILIINIFCVCTSSETLKFSNFLN
jgi:hypothetical protein